MVEIFHIQATEPTDATEPVNLIDAKDWANIDHDDDDALLYTMITGARQDIEKETNLLLIEKLVVVMLNTTCANDRAFLPYLVGENLTVKDEDYEDVSDDEYKVSGSVIRISSPGAYEVSYTSGEPTTATSELIKMLVAYRYNNRGDGAVTMPDDIRNRAAKYRREWL